MSTFADHVADRAQGAIQFAADQNDRREAARILAERYGWFVTQRFYGDDIKARTQAVIDESEARYRQGRRG